MVDGVMVQVDDGLWHFIHGLCSAVLMAYADPCEERPQRPGPTISSNVDNEIAHLDNEIMYLVIDATAYLQGWQPPAIYAPSLRPLEFGPWPFA